MVKPPWRTPVIVELARQSIKENSWELSLILADALEELEGPQRMIDHLRNTSNHTPNECGFLYKILREEATWDRG